MAEEVQAGTYDELLALGHKGAFVVVAPPDKTGVYIGEKDAPWAPSPGGSLPVIDARTYNVDPTGASDDTAAFAAAAAAAFAYGSVRPPIFLPPGSYNVHEVSIAHGISFVGAGVGPRDTIIRYNGAGGVGSAPFLMDIPNSGTSALSNGLFKNLSIFGYDGTTTGHIAENILKWDTTIGLDWGFVLDYVWMGYCYGDAIKFAAAQASAITNFHGGPIRIDQVGGYAFSIDATGAGAVGQRDFELDKLTMDSRKPNGNFSTAAQADGRWNGTDGWGKGLLLAKECGGTTFRVGIGRFEINGAMAPVSGVNALVRVDNSQTSVTRVHFDDVLIAPQSGDAMVACHNIGATEADFLWMNADGNGRVKAYQSTNASPTNDIGVNGITAAMLATPSNGGIQGVTLGGRKIERRSSTPVSPVNVDYEYGDVILNNAPQGVVADGWVCIAPMTGFSNPTTTAQDSTATWGTSNGVVTPTSAANLRKFPVGMNVVLVGGGAAGVNLNCRVTAIDPTAGTFTVNATPSTAKTGNGTINYQQPTWRQLGVTRDALRIGVQGYSGETSDRGNSTGATALTSDALHGGLVYLKAGDVVTTLYFDVETSGTKGASGACYAALYDSAGNQLAISADLTVAVTTGSAANITAAMTAPYTITADGAYYLCVYSNFATTQPSIARGSGGGQSGAAIGSGVRRYTRQASCGGAPTNPATFGNGTINPWVAWA